MILTNNRGQSDIVTQKTTAEIKVIYAKQIFHYKRLEICAWGMIFILLS